ncbi:hypothetical protein [Owenweeksia hongkongensis]|uniref:hypothetical protein n=1 Tax=Owenweeksia hongkongensis TaxID=253245 RepID=UPI003A8E8374
MKRLTLLLSFLFASFMACHGQYEPAPSKDTIEGYYTEGEIRRFLLTQEKGSPVWKLARQSRTSNTVGVSTAVLGATLLVAGGIGLASATPENDSFGILEVVSYATIGIGAVSTTIGTWQLVRSHRKLEQSKKLYKHK